MENKAEYKAKVDFICLVEDCKSTIAFNVFELEKNDGRIICSSCHQEYNFDPIFVDKMKRFRDLLLSIRRAEDLLGDAAIGVTTPAGEELIPYRLLLTRLNTCIRLNVGNTACDFRLRIEPIDGKIV